MSNSVYDFTVQTPGGAEKPLAEYKGKVLLVVNTASKCGFTPQFGGLEETYEKYQAQGLEVLGFPCNQFGAQEPGTNAEICEFTAEKYDVSFPLMAKVDVKGEGKTGLYSILSEVADADGYSGDIRWNFEKFLIEADGTIQRFSTRVTPESISL